MPGKDTKAKDVKEPDEQPKADACNKPALRLEYEAKVRALKDKVPQNLEKLSEAEKEQVARQLSAERRQLSTEYKDITPPDLREKIYQRNLTKYGDKLGPTVDWLRARGKSWEAIIEGATRPGGADVFGPAAKL